MEQNKIEEIVHRIEKVLPKTKGKFAPEDISATTGFSLSDVNDGLKRLLEIYRAKVAMDTNTGKLVFQFLYPLEKVGKRSFGEVLYSFLQALWKIFTIVYKAAIGVILIVYTVVFVIIILALILASSQSNDRDRRGGLDMSIFSGIFRAIFEGMYLLSWSNAIQNVTDPSGLRYKHYEKDKNKGKNFVQAVFHFVLGPDNPPVDKYADEKEAIAYIRKVSKGKLTAADIVLLTGCTYNEAEERLARYATKYNGELEVNEDGVVTADFQNLLHSAAKVDEGQIIYYYDEIEPPATLTDNSTGRNVAIILMNTFNLVVSAIFAFGPATYFIKGVEVAVPWWFSIGLGWFPFLFSISFFLIPIFRIPFTAIAKKNRNKNIMRKKLFFAIYKLKKNITLESIAQMINLPKELFDEAQNVLNKLVPELRGEINLEGNKAIINADNFIDNISILK